MSDPGYYKQLTRSMVAKVIVVSLTPLLLLSATTGYMFHTSYKSKVLAHLEELVGKHRQTVDSFLKERTAEILTMAGALPLSRLKSEADLDELLGILQQEYEGVFVDLGLVDGNGIQVAYAGPFRLGQARYAEADWFKQVRERKVFVSDVFLGLRGLPHFIVAVRKQDEAGRDWILRSTIDFVAFNKLVENISLGETGMAFIVNRSGQFQTTPRVDLSGEIPRLLAHLAALGPASSGGESAQPVKAPGGQALHASERTHVLLDTLAQDGREAVYVTAPLKGGEWILVFRQDAADAFRDLSWARQLNILLVVIGALVILIKAVILSRRMVNHIRRADLEKEKVTEQFIEAGKLASVGELAAGIAHEINNPVAIMVEEAGWIEDLLAEEQSLREDNRAEIDRALAQIRTQGARCKEITHKLLSFARRTDPSVKRISLGDVVEEILAIAEQRARFANVSLRFDNDPELPSIEASPTEMQQVVLNLVNNAVDAMEPTGGTIVVTVRKDGESVVLDVADTGPGIAKANLQRIFDPFFTTKPVGKGTGLGLSIVYGIVKKMGGDLSVESAMGQGTTFHIRLPIRSAAVEGGAGDTQQ